MRDMSIETSQAYRDTCAETLARTFDCGHGVDSETRAKLTQAVETGAYSIGSGYARQHGTDRTMCYPCAERSEREDFARATSYGAYVNEDRREVTTWTGGRLARLTSVHTARSGFAGTLRYVTAVDDNGNVWRGKGSAEYDAVTLRR